jgi:hypothetical protein
MKEAGKKNNKGRKWRKRKEAGKCKVESETRNQKKDETIKYKMTKVTKEIRKLLFFHITSIFDDLGLKGGLLFPITINPDDKTDCAFHTMH